MALFCGNTYEARRKTSVPRGVAGEPLSLQRFAISHVVPCQDGVGCLYFAIRFCKVVISWILCKVLLVFYLSAYCDSTASRPSLTSVVSVKRCNSRPYGCIGVDGTSSPGPPSGSGRYRVRACRLNRLDSCFLLVSRNVVTVQQDTRTALQLGDSVSPLRSTRRPGCLRRVIPATPKNLRSSCTRGRRVS